VGQDPRYLMSHPLVALARGAPLFVRARLVGVIFAESGRVAAFAEEHEQCSACSARTRRWRVVGEANGQPAAASGCPS